MQHNVGGMDRLMRLIVGLSFVIWAISGGPWWSWFGVLILATALFRTCGFYSLIGFSTRTSKKDFL